MMTKLTRVRLKNLYDRLYAASTSAEQLVEKDEGTEPGNLGKEAADKLDDLMMSVSSLLADDEDGSLLSRTR